MKTRIEQLFLIPTLIASLGLILAAPAQAQYTFGPQVQSTNTASITYDSGTGAFQYTDTNNIAADFAGLPLAGNVANYITTSNGWTASLSAALSARSIPGNGPYVAMGLYLVINTNDGNTVKISLNQENNSGSGGNLNFYGTEVLFEAVTNYQILATTPLGTSGNFGGISYQELSGGTSASVVTKSINAASGVLALTNDASTDTLTGYYDGVPVGSISLASWGPNPSLTIAVVGYSGYGINVPAGTDTASNFSAGLLQSSAPQLTLIHSGTNVILTWPTNIIGFTLQSTTNLVSPAVWSAVSPTNVVVNGQNTVTNPIFGPRMFFRLTQ